MDCPTWPELSGTEWGDRLLAPITGQRYPLSGSIDLTERCNLNCLHCYINQPAKDVKARAGELRTDQVIDILDQISEAGCLFLMLTGGEILMRPDFAQIYRHAKRRGLILTLFTNATMVTEEIADLFAELPPNIIEVSLYGATPATFDGVTRVKGSYARCIQGIERLQARGLTVMLKSVLLRENVHELAQMRTIAENFNAPFRYDATLWPRLDGNIAPYAHRLTIQENLALDEADPIRQQAWVDVAALSHGALIRAEYVFSCGAGFRSFHIDSRGKLSMCIMLRQPAYDILTMGFEEAWGNMGAERERKRQLGTECETCTLGALCTQCPGWSQIVHGDLETPVDFICQLAKERAKRLSYGKISINSEEILSYE